jgi:hypothetical protein
VNDDNGIYCYHCAVKSICDSDARSEGLGTTCMCVSEEACGYIMWCNCPDRFPIDVSTCREQWRLGELSHSYSSSLIFLKAIAFLSVLPFFDLRGVFSEKGVNKKEEVMHQMTLFHNKWNINKVIIKSTEIAFGIYGRSYKALVFPVHLWVCIIMWWYRSLCNHWKINILSCDRVIIDVVWIGDWIYWPLADRNCK